jgi:hypothetical protein
MVLHKRGKNHRAQNKAKKQRFIDPSSGFQIIVSCAPLTSTLICSCRFDILLNGVNFFNDWHAYKLLSVLQENMVFL